MTIYLRNLLKRQTPGDNISVDELKLCKEKKELNELGKKEREQLIAEMILYCSPEVWVMNRYREQHRLKNEKVKKEIIGKPVF